MNHLLHPDLISRIPIFNKKIALRLNAAAKYIASIENTITYNNISIVIRTLNEADALERLFEDIKNQKFKGNVEIIVVDNESTDSTIMVAEKFKSKIITIPRGSFTYPLSMNLGVEAASHDIVLLTVGHTMLSNDQFLNAAVLHFGENKITGVHAANFLPSEKASFTEFLIAMGLPMYFERHIIKKAGMGVLGANNAVISKKVWNELGRFDENYESGGEDTALAAKMIAHGYHIMYEPALMVHHSHNLGVVGYIRQRHHWNKTLRGPVKLNKAKLAARRPDINFD